MEAEILFPVILSFVERKEVKISQAKRRRLKKKARRVLSIREDDGAVRNPVNQSADGLSLRIDGLSPAIGVNVAVKKRKPEPIQVSDVLPVVEDEDSVKRMSVSPSEQLSPLVVVHSIMADNSRKLCFPNSFSTCTQVSSNLPRSDLFDDEGPLCPDVHCSVETRLGEKYLKQVRDGINIESGFGLVAPRLKRKTRSKSIADGHRYNLRTPLKKD